MNAKGKSLSAKQVREIIDILTARFHKNKHLHKGIDWTDVAKNLEANPQKLWTLNEMETTGGEPDVVSLDKSTGEYIFYDCSPESPKGRRSLCYDREALDARKEHKPKHNAVDVAAAMGVELLTEEEYLYLQSLANFDAKTSSWLKTPEKVRNLDGAIFGDFRFGRVFIYHNGAESYYAARGFRASLRV